MSVSLLTTFGLALAVAPQNGIAPASDSVTADPAQDSGSALGAAAGSAPVLGFTNRTVEAGLSAKHSPHSSPALTIAQGGGAAADFDNDGWTDLLFLSGGGQGPDKLFMNDGDGTFTDQAAAWGLTEEHLGAAVSAADYNGDGWIDLFLSSWAPKGGEIDGGWNKLYRNNGDRSFTDVAVELGVNLVSDSYKSFGSAWGDYDLDGDLDLFVATYETNEESNRLFRNDIRETGAEGFTDVTEEADLAFDGVSGFVPSFIDLTGDRYPELCLVADQGTSRYFVNDGDGTFTDMTSSAGGLSTANGMGTAFGDINGDGLLEWFVSSIYYSTIGGPGNVLMLNNGDGTWSNIARSAGVRDGGWGWGVLIVDVDNDGWNDLVETNGWTVGNEWANEPSYLYLNNRDLTFEEVGVDVGFEWYESSRGLINFDADNDGDQDLVVFTHKGELAYFQNDLSGDNTNWLKVDLDSRKRSTIAPQGMGSYIYAVDEGRTAVACIDGAINMCSQGELGAHFGFAGETVLDSLRVAWADGSFTTLTNVPVNRRLRIVAPVHPTDYDRNDVVNGHDYFAYMYYYLADSLRADYDGSGEVTSEDLEAFISALEGVLGSD